MTEAIFTERRLGTDGYSTLSELLFGGERICFTLEPGDKTPVHPRKPPGRYQLILRQEGGKYAEYRKMFGPAWFVGIPQIIVPNRSFIEVHIGNTVHDTEGCSLLGAASDTPKISMGGHYEVRRSREAFLRVYPQIRDACLAGPCWWETLAEGAAVA